MLEGDTNNNDKDGGAIEETLTKLEHEPEITLHALTRWTTSKPMKVTVKVVQYDVMVLIDSGSTQNFISENIASLLQLPVVPIEPFSVRIANRRSLKFQERFEHVQILLQGIHFSLTLYSVPLIRLDLVLGVQWLEQLGTVVCNWKKMTMEFQ